SNNDEIAAVHESAYDPKRTLTSSSRHFQLAGLTRYDALPRLWGNEATHIHQVARWCGGVAARCARAAVGDAGDWVSPYRLIRSIRSCGSGLSPRPDGK